MNLETLEVSQGMVGNTKTIPKKQCNQIKSWFFTFNNYTERDISILLERFNDICERYVFEREIGDSGTPHLQGVIFLKESMRWSQFKLSDKINWSATKKEKDAIKYCTKDYNSCKISGLDIWVKDIKLKKQLKLITPDRLYQKFILNIIKTEPNDRDVYWFCDHTGNVGKSSFSKYLVYKHNAIYIDEGDKKDISFYISEQIKNDKEIEIVLFDIPRANENRCSYKSIEAIKGGMMFSSKYESGSIIFNSPHLFVFSNFLPEMSKLSNDRWKIFEIKSDYSVVAVTTVV